MVLESFMIRVISPSRVITILVMEIHNNTYSNTFKEILLILQVTLQKIKK